MYFPASSFSAHLLNNLPPKSNFVKLFFLLLLLFFSMRKAQLLLVFFLPLLICKETELTLVLKESSTQRFLWLKG